MKKSKYILDSHKRCEHLQADKIQPSVITLRLKDIEKELVQVTGESLSKNRSTFFALYNSFFTVTNRELAVLNCFVNKNSNTDIKSYAPVSGTILREDSFGTNAISISSIKGDVAYVLRDEHYRKQSKKLSCVAAPVRLGDEIIGYMGLSIINKWEMNGMRAFIESFSYNIAVGIVKTRLTNKLTEYLMHYGMDINHSRAMPYFTEKEKQIVGYLIKAYSYDIIAGKVGISEATVRTYLRRIFDKCGTKNRVDTAVFMVCSEIAEATKL